MNTNDKQLVTSILARIHAVSGDVELNLTAEELAAFSRAPRRIDPGRLLSCFGIAALGAISYRVAWMFMAS